MGRRVKVTDTVLTVSVMLADVTVFRAGRVLDTCVANEFAHCFPGSSSGHIHNQMTLFDHCYKISHFHKSYSVILQGKLGGMSIKAEMPDGSHEQASTK